MIPLAMSTYAGHGLSLRLAQHPECDHQFMGAVGLWSLASPLWLWRAGLAPACILSSHHKFHFLKIPVTNARGTMQVALLTSIA